MSTYLTWEELLAEEAERPGPRVSAPVEAAASPPVAPSAVAPEKPPAAEPDGPEGQDAAASRRRPALPGGAIFPEGFELPADIQRLIAERARLEQELKVLTGQAPPPGEDAHFKARFPVHRREKLSIDDARRELAREVKAVRERESPKAVAPPWRLDVGPARAGETIGKGPKRAETGADWIRERTEHADARRGRSHENPRRREAIAASEKPLKPPTSAQPSTEARLDTERPHASATPHAAARDSDAAAEKAPSRAREPHDVSVGAASLPPVQPWGARHSLGVGSIAHITSVPPRRPSPSAGLRARFEIAGLEAVSSLPVEVPSRKSTDGPPARAEEERLAIRCEALPTRPREKDNSMPRRRVEEEVVTLAPRRRQDRAERLREQQREERAWENRPQRGDGRSR
jgi:hypothetical protein